MEKGFVHLHLHTEYSLLDGACRIDRLMPLVKEMGQTAVAITDHGAMFGCVEFYKAAKRHGLKPIVGCEVYMATRRRIDKVNKLDGSYHLVLLCKNETGYKNLMRLVSLAYTEGFYSKPRVDWELLEQYHEGLICLSACLAGEIPRLLLSGDMEKARQQALRYQSLFGRENYYIEIQDHGIKDQQAVLPHLIRLARGLGIPLVATNDAHYLTRADAKMQQALICIQTGKTINDDDKLEFGTDEFYVKTTEEMYALFSHVPEACENTVKIADQCSFDFEFGHTLLPDFEAPGKEDNEAYFRRLCREGFVRLYGKNPKKEAEQRLEYEISVISKMGYTNYYLIVADFISFARSRGIPVGPGRGSGAGSIAAYCMGITGVDPLAFNLLFERFLNPERISMPDFDIDFCYERRQEVIDYVIGKYGADHVVQIITFGTMAARAAIRDVGRVLDIPYQKVDAVAKMVPMELKMTLEKALKVAKPLAEACQNDPQVKELIHMAQSLEGMPRHASTHAAGVVITPRAASEYVPLSTNDGAVVTQYTMTTIEELGLLKMDFLGLRTLTVIQDAEKMVKRTSPGFSVDSIPYDDARVYRMLSSGETDGVFQLESGGMKQTLVGLKPENLEDVIALISLYRPGPMDSIPTYIRNRHNRGRVSYATPRLEPILKVTYGCIVYQEQVMQIFRELAGFSYGQADLVRRAMSKKKHDVMEQQRRVFIHGSTEKGSECPGCVANGIPAEVANEIFDDMSSFASYAFNKSHAAAYAFVAYQTAYLKCHYPRQFMAALMTSVLDFTSKVISYINESRHMGIRVLPPDINESEAGFTVQGENIRYGLLALKNVGRSLIEAVVRSRAGSGKFSSLYDFCLRMNGTELNRRAVESFIKSGAFDSIEPNRHAMLKSLEGILKSVDGESRRNIEGQINLFEAAGMAPQNSFRLAQVDEYPKEMLLQQEKEVSGMYLSGHPLEKYQDIIDKVGTTNVAKLVSEEEQVKDNAFVRLACTIAKVKFYTTKSNEAMAFITAEDLSGSIEILAFPKVLQKAAELVKDNSAVVVEGYTSVKEEEEPKIIAQKILNIADCDPARIKAEASRQYYGLFLTLPGRNSGKYEQVCETLKVYPGDWPVYMRFEDTGEKGRVSRALWCQQNRYLLEELIKIIGKDNVKNVALEG